MLDASYDDNNDDASDALAARCLFGAQRRCPQRRRRGGDHGGRGGDDDDANRSCCYSCSSHRCPDRLGRRTAAELAPLPSLDDANNDCRTDSEPDDDHATVGGTGSRRRRPSPRTALLSSRKRPALTRTTFAPSLPPSPRELSESLPIQTTSRRGHRTLATFVSPRPQYSSTLSAIALSSLKTSVVRKKVGLRELEVIARRDRTHEVPSNGSRHPFMPAIGSTAKRRAHSTPRNRNRAKAGPRDFGAGHPYEFGQGLPGAEAPQRQFGENWVVLVRSRRTSGT